MQQPLKITPDFSEAKSFSVFPNGTFLCKVVDFEGKQSQAGNPMINWQFEIVEDSPYTDPKDGSQQNRKGRRLFRNTPATGKGAGFLKEVLTGLGYDYKKFVYPDSKVHLKGRQVYITTVSDTYKGETRNQAGSFKAAPQA